MKTIKNAFVLGGSGYIGQYLVNNLLRNRIAVTTLVHRTPPAAASPLLTSVPCSLTDYDWSTLPAATDVIFHAARFAGKDRKSRLRAAQKNRHANQQLVAYLKTLDAPPLLVFVSGTLVYGSHGTTLVDEHTAPNPISFQREYFIAEKPILQALESKEIPVIIARPSWVYGPGSWLKAFFLQPAKSKNHVPQYGKGTNLMAFIHVQDVDGMLLHLSQEGKPGNIYNLSTQPAIAQKEFSELLSRITDAPVRKKPVWWLHLRYEKALVEAFTFSLNLTTKYPAAFQSYTPRYPDLKEGLKEVVQQSE